MVSRLLQRGAAVPIVFRCPACGKRLSIASRKAGARVACPNCGAEAAVPGTAASQARGSLLPLAVLAGGLSVLVVGVALVLALALRKSAPDEQAKAELPAPRAPAAPVPPGVPPQRPPAPKSLPPGFTLPGVPQTVAAPAKPQAEEEEIAVAPPPRPAIGAQPPQVPPQPQMLPLDKFGNPVGHTVGLGHDGEFKGKKLLFWSGFENAGRVFFHPTNPLWKALEAKGFVVTRAFGRFNPAWLKEFDQLWVLSTGRLDLPAGITPDLLDFAVSQLPASAVPSGFTLAEYQFVVRATLDVALGPVHPLDAQAYRAIEDFVKAGKGLCLLADDEPFCAEANELARRLFNSRVGGNYVADKVATVRGRGLTPAEIRKFGGQYEVTDHPLLAGVNFLFEGITVSNVAKSDKLEVALKASDGKALVAVSKVPGQRVVIDCGFTRYCHGPTERTSYILKTAGTVRLAQNIAAYLAGKDAPKP